MDFYREIHGKRSGGKEEIEPYANGIVPLAFYKGGGEYESFISDSGNFALDRRLFLSASALY